MEITERLVGDHKTFRKMLADIESIHQQEPAGRDVPRLIRIVELFRTHLVVHAWFEDNFYYPAIQKELARFAGGPVNAAYMHHLEREHVTVDGYLDRLETDVKAGSFGWPQAYALFSRGLQSHMKREEEELFPESRRVLGHDVLEALSAEMEKRRSEAPKARPHRRI